MERKYCPICGEEMEYKPSGHWTGTRYVLLQNTWVCFQRNHKLQLIERVKQKPKVK